MAHNKQSVELRGSRTSLSLEGEYWTALQEIAAEENITVQDLLEQIKQGYDTNRLTAAVRLFVLKHYQNK